MTTVGVVSRKRVNIVLSWLEDDRLRPKHVAKYNPTVITASCLDVYCVLTVHNILHRFEIHGGMASFKFKWLIEFFYILCIFRNILIGRSQ